MKKLGAVFPLELFGVLVNDEGADGYPFDSTMKVFARAPKGVWKELAQAKKGTGMTLLNTAGHDAPVIKGLQKWYEERDNEGGSPVRSPEAPAEWDGSVDKSDDPLPPVEKDGPGFTMEEHPES